MNSYRLSLGGGQQAANATSEPFYAVWNLESHPGTILGGWVGGSKVIIVSVHILYVRFLGFKFSG